MESIPGTIFGICHVTI